MPFIPTKSVVCISTSWLLGNVYAAKSCKGKNRDSDALKLRLTQLQETTLTGNIDPLGYSWAGSGADNPTLEKTFVTKSDEAIAGYFSWQKLLRKAGAHVGLSSQR
jgi:hypothetical protein